MEFRFLLNGKAVTVNAAPEQMLINVLRNFFHIASVRRGCEGGLCGICSVLVDGVPIQSCLVPMFRTPGPTSSPKRVCGKRGNTKTFWQPLPRPTTTPATTAGPRQCSSPTVFLNEVWNQRKLKFWMLFPGRAVAAPILKRLSRRSGAPDVS